MRRLKPYFHSPISRLKLELKLQAMYGRDRVTSIDTVKSRIYSLDGMEIAYWREGIGLIPELHELPQTG